MDGEAAPVSPTIDRNCEKSFRVEDIDQISLRNENGEPVLFGQLRNGKSAIVVFLRHFLDYTTQEYVEDFSKIDQESLLESNVQIFFVGCAPSKFIKDFRQQTGCVFSIYCDSKRLIYKKLQLYEGPIETLKSKHKSVHIKSSNFVGNFKTFINSMISQQFQGDVFQQGGEAIIDQKGEVLLFNRAKHPLDHTPINELLNILHLPLVDFSSRYRIQTV